MRLLLGGKGAGLAEMANAGLPVPKGFTITTEACINYLKNNEKWPQGLEEQYSSALKKLEKAAGKQFGPENPLLVSVRSGAAVSMPGMMDTVLNIGMNDRTLEILAKKTGNRKFALDSYRRLIHMFSDVVDGIDIGLFESILEGQRKKHGAKKDFELPEKALEDIVREYKELYRKKMGKDFPQSPEEQLRKAVNAVFNSWNTKRAKTYRKLNKIPDDLGTAVNVQEMVFGNLDSNSGTGVMFTRNPANGTRELYGEFLMNAQGEDVVAGIRTPQNILKIKETNPEIFKQLEEVAKKLELHYKD